MMSSYAAPVPIRHRDPCLRDATQGFDLQAHGPWRPGFLVALTTLLDRTTNPTDNEIAEAIANIEDCGSSRPLRSGPSPTAATPHGRAAGRA